MNKVLYSLFGLLTGCLLFNACSKNDDGETPSSDCYISDFKLGTLKRTVTTNGTTTQTTYNGAYYPMSIDQRNGMITNPTPLLSGTSLSAVLATITAKGTVVYAPASDPSVWTSYVSTDSINFTSPLLFRVYATNGAGYREYKLTVNMRSQDAGEYTWESLAAPSFIEERTSRRAVEWGDGLLLLSTDRDGGLHRAIWADNVWSEEQPCTGAEGAVLSSLQSYDKQLWMHTGDGQLLCSADGISWTSVPQELDHTITLLAASGRGLYARLHGTGKDAIALSTDGHTWDSVPVETDIAMFPGNTRSVSYTKNGYSRVLVAGEQTDSQEKQVVSIWNYLEGYKAESWILFAKTGDNDYILPWSDNLSIVAYNNWLIAIDGNSTTTYRSEDNGITWKSYTELTLPHTHEHFAAVSAGDYIYIFAGKHMQRALIYK